MRKKNLCWWTALSLMGAIGLLAVLAGGSRVTVTGNGLVSYGAGGLSAILAGGRRDAAPRFPSISARQNKVNKAGIAQTYGQLPLHFEVNKGQANNDVKFLSRGSGYNLSLTANGAVLSLSSPQRTQKAQRKDSKYPSAPSATSAVNLRMKLVGANPQPQVSGMEELPGKVNHFIGDDPQRWHANVPTYAKVKYDDVYPGVDLVYYGNQSQLEYDFVVSPGADPKNIALSLEGADKVEVDKQGDLVLRVNGGEVRQHKPLMYQEINGERREIPGGYVLQSDAGDHVSRFMFHVADYDETKPLIIDPVLSYSTYFGGTGYDFGNGITVDSNGNAYVAGTIGSDAFVMKLNAAGSAFAYVTYLGGSGSDKGNGIAVDSSGNAYVIGETLSTNFPTKNAFQSSLKGSGTYDAFVSKLNAAGSALVYSTYLGGNGSDYGGGIAIDSAGKAYVIGSTTSTNLPTKNAWQATLRGSLDVFVARFNVAGSALGFSTYLGGSGGDLDGGIAVDSAGNACVVGETFSTNFPMLNAVQPTFGGMEDAFVAKFNASGSALYSTYLGGNQHDRGFGVATDSSGNAYVTGLTYSTNFPTKNPLQPSLGSSNVNDAFVTKLSPDGSALVYSTYLGGASNDQGYGIAVDSEGNACVTGSTQSSNFPTRNPLQAALSGMNDRDAFVARLYVTGSALVYSTYLGGSGFDQGNSIAVDPSGNAWVTGWTYSTNFPTMNPAQATRGGASDAFVTRIDDAPVKAAELSITQTDFPDPASVGGNLTYTITVTNNGPDAATDVSVIDTLPSYVTFISATSSQGSCQQAGGMVFCDLGDLANGATATITIVVTPTQTGSITNRANVASPEVDLNSANNTAAQGTTVM